MSLFTGAFIFMIALSTHATGQQAELIDGNALYESYLERLRPKVQEFQEKYSTTPSVVMVQVGSLPDANIYVQKANETADSVGIRFDHVKLDFDSTEEDLLNEIDRLNADDQVDGILMVLPLITSNGIDTNGCIDKILPSKDVEGLTAVNVARLGRGQVNETVLPCSAKAIWEMVKSTGVDVKNKRVVVIGNNQWTIKPSADIFFWNEAVVTMCQPNTENLKEITREADILITSVKTPKMIKGDWIKPGAIVIDSGFSTVPDDDGKKILAGDVDFEEAKKVAGFITPLPGGVGPMIRAMLMENTLYVAEQRQIEKRRL